MATFDRCAKFVIVVLGSIILGSATANACSMFVLPEPPRSSVNPGMYILVGEVIGYTEPVTDPNNFRGSAVGLKMKIVEPIQVPHQRKDFVEVFMFRHGTDCVTEAIEGKPKLGTRFRLALYPARLVSSFSADDRVRLESRVFDRIAIDEPLAGFSTSANDVFDYRTNIPVLRTAASTPQMIDKRRWVDDFLYIETSKDLIRYANAADEVERLSVLERLLYSPYVDYRGLLLPGFGNNEQMGTSYRRAPPPQLTKKELRGLSKKKRQLLEERIKLEESGKLRLWN